MGRPVPSIPTSIANTSPTVMNFSISGGIHDNEDSRQSNQPAEQVKSIGHDLVDAPAPENCHHDKDPAIGGIDSAEICGLKGGNEPIKYQHQRATQGQPDAFPFFDPKPNQITAANLAKGSQNEKENRLD